MVVGVQIVVMGPRAVLEVGLEEEQQEPLTVEILPMPLEEEEEVQITAPAEAVPMAAAVGPKTGFKPVWIPVVPRMGVPVEHPGDPECAGCRPTAERVMLRAAAAVVPLSMETAPIRPGRWELLETMVTEPAI